MFEDNQEFEFDDEFESSLPSITSNQPQFSLEHPPQINSFTFKVPPVRPPSPNKKKRKFPGPAGALPHQFDITNLNETLTQDLEAPPPSQDESISHFLEPPWLEMKSNFNSNLLENYNIDWIKNKLESNSLVNQKAPFLAAVITHIEWFQLKIQTITLSLKDPTGEIKAVMLPELYEGFSEEIVVGAVVVLRRFGVLTMGLGKSHCVIITANNLLTVYSKGKKGVKKVRVVGEEDFGDSFVKRFRKNKSVLREEIQSLQEQDDAVERNVFSIRNERICDNGSNVRVSENLEEGNIFESDAFDFNNLEFDDAASNTFQPQFSSTQPDEPNVCSKTNQQETRINLPVSSKRNQTVNNRISMFSQEKFSQQILPGKRETETSEVLCPTEKTASATKNTNLNVKDRLKDFRFLAKGPPEVSHKVSPIKPAITVINCSQESLENSQILQEAFEGIDTNSLFDDF